MTEARAGTNAEANTEATRKNVLIVSAHPDPRSLTASLTSFAEEELKAAGHRVRVSDLYAMKWRSGLDADDFPELGGDRLLVQDVQGRATREGSLAADIAAEQEKVRWADAVILQYPLWWFSVPAVMKGWIDRVFTFGWAYGAEHPPPYSEGALAGRRALVSVTVGAREGAFSDRGIHGRLSDVLYPVQHGLFWFSGMAPLEPFALFDANELSDEEGEQAKRAYAERLKGLFTDAPVPFRRLDEDYDHDMRLLPGREAPGASGTDLHLR